MDADASWSVWLGAVWPWSAQIIEQWVCEVRPLLAAEGNPALWPSERGPRVGLQRLDSRLCAYRRELGMDEGVDFQLTHADWIAVLREAGFEVERLVELQAPADAKRHPYYSDIPPEWARQWPGEEIWVARKR